MGPYAKITPESQHVSFWVDSASDGYMLRKIQNPNMSRR